MNAPKTIDFIEASVYVLVGAFVIVILLWEPVQTFWQKRTWREEGGVFVRDYTALRASLKKAAPIALLTLAGVVIYLLL